MSPTVIDSAGRASRYPPSAPRRDSTNPPCLRLARISSRNFCGMRCRRAISAILTGSPAGCDARSKMACKAYSPLTEMFKQRLYDREGGGGSLGVGLGPEHSCRPAPIPGVQNWKRSPRVTRRLLAADPPPPPPGPPPKPVLTEVGCRKNGLVMTP